MKSVYFATGNKGKYISLSKELKKYEINLIHNPMSFDKELDSERLDEIACDKVLRAYKEMKKSVIALDAGWYIPSLDNRPGTKINPFLKKHGIEGILKLLEGKERFCEFRQCLAYIGPDIENPKIFESYTKGVISKTPKGCTEGKPAWSDLWLIFIPEGESKTLAEMSEEEYMSWRIKRDKHSVGVKFGRWYSLRQE